MKRKLSNVLYTIYLQHTKFRKIKYIYIYENHLLCIVQDKYKSHIHLGPYFQSDASQNLNSIWPILNILHVADVVWVPFNHIV